MTIVEFLNANNILHQFQFGFRPMMSTRDAIFTLAVAVDKAKRLRKANPVLLFVDLHAAYDSVQRRRLFEALDDLGFGGKVQHLIESFYTRDKVFFEYLHVRGFLLSKSEFF